MLKLSSTILAMFLVLNNASQALETPASETAASPTGPAATETQSLTQGNFRTDFTDIDNFDALLASEIRECDPQKDNLKNPTTFQNCTILDWAKNQYKNLDEIPKCQQYFIDSKGKIGPLGQLISKSIAKDIQEKRENSAFMQNSEQLNKVMAGNQLCPAFKDFTPQTKVAFYTWAMELTAFAESSCNPDIKFNTAADVPNGPAVGLYQLELKRETRGWRGGACKTLDEKQILTAEGNTACAFQIFRSFLEKKGMPFGDYDEKTKKTTPFSYWHSHNPMPDAQFTGMLTKYKACKAKNPKNYKNACPWDPRAKFYARLAEFPLCKGALPE